MFGPVWLATTQTITPHYFLALFPMWVPSLLLSVFSMVCRRCTCCSWGVILSGVLVILAFTCYASGSDSDCSQFYISWTYANSPRFPISQKISEAKYPYRHNGLPLALPYKSLSKPANQMTGVLPFLWQHHTELTLFFRFSTNAASHLHPLSLLFHILLLDYHIRIQTHQTSNMWTLQHRTFSEHKYCHSCIAVHAFPVHLTTVAAFKTEMTLSQWPIPKENTLTYPHGIRSAGPPSHCTAAQGVCPECCRAHWDGLCGQFRSQFFGLHALHCIEWRSAYLTASFHSPQGWTWGQPQATRSDWQNDKKSTNSSTIIAKRQLHFMYSVGSYPSYWKSGRHTTLSETTAQSSAISMSFTLCLFVGYPTGRKQMRLACS